jgi:hypothetical protein
LRLSGDRDPSQPHGAGGLVSILVALGSLFVLNLARLFIEILGEVPKLLPHPSIFGAIRKVAALAGTIAECFGVGFHSVRAN